MKKIFSFFMALCLAAGAYAMPQVPQMNTVAKQHKVMTPAPTAQTRMMKPQPVLKTLPAVPQLTDVQPIEGKRIMKQINPNQRPAIRPMARKMANGTTTDISIADGYAGFLGTTFYVQYGSFIYAWQFSFTGSNDEDITVIAYDGYSDTRIEGEYEDLIAIITINNVEIEAEGTFSIVYKEASVNTDKIEYSSPVYTFAGSFTDAEGNVYNLSGDYAFEYGGVFDFYYYEQYIMYCMYMGQYCDEIFYDLTDFPVEPSGEETSINIENAANKSYYSNEGGWYISAEDENFGASVEIYAEDIVGNFEGDQLSKAYTTLISYEGGDTTYVDMYKPLSAVVTENEEKDSMFFEVKMLGMDGMTYIVNMFYAKPVINDTIDILAVADIYDYTEEDGVLMFQGQSFDLIPSDTTYMISGAIFANALEGEFTEMDAYQGGSYDQIVLLTATDTALYVADSYKMTIALSPGEEGEEPMYMIAWGVDAYNVEDREQTHHFNIVTLASVFDAFAYDADVDTAYTFTAAREDVIITDYFEEESGSIYIMAFNSDSTCMFMGLIIANTIDESYLIPLDVYEINDSEEAPSMLASIGYYPFYEMDMPSYFATAYNYWYLVEGTATMEADKLTIEGLNSKGKACNITINFTNTGLKEMMQEARINKMMHNGRLYIMRGDKMFDIIGNRMK